jgi:hypothetical protein
VDMSKILKGILVSFGLLFVIIVTGVLLQRDELEPDASNVQIPDETEVLWILSDSNVRSGPGKNYDIITNLKMFDQVKVFKNDTAEWKKITDPVEGYIFHSLIGDLDTAQKKYVKNVDNTVQMLKDFGVVIKVDGGDLYVNRYLWIDLDGKTRNTFMKRYANALQIKWKAEYVSCTIYDYRTGIKIISYNTRMDMFFKN